MAGVGQIQQLQQDLQNELTMTNQLLRLISVELTKIKSLTSFNGEFETNIKQNALLVDKLGNILKMDSKNLPYTQKVLRNNEGSVRDKNISHVQNDTNVMDESQ